MLLMDTPMRRARLVVAYDGGAFHGFAKNRDVVTVAGTLEDALSLVSRVPVEIVGAGRTDAGVHAWGQVVSADLPAATDMGSLARRLNKLCGPAIAVRSADWAAHDTFHARFDALWRHYRYTILNTEAPNPFLARTTWHVQQPLDLHLMQLASDAFIGEHDFTSFCRRPKVDHPDRSADPGSDGSEACDEHRPSMVRRVLLADWSQLDGGLVRLDIRATAFCHQMVRSITGTMVDVGLGRRRAGEMMGILRAKDRNQAGQVAPPEGLCLWEVAYPDS
jgi:tRNA pseudouridine38-40 synthase